MKLNVVPARTGTQWVRQGVRVFFRQPLAIAGLFFMFLAATAVLSWLPIAGDVLALGLIPAATVGLMAASREVEAGRFPMPSLLIIGFRSGPAKRRAMALLGALYAACVLVIIGVSSLLDDGQLARLIESHGGSLSAETIADPAFQQAVQSAMQPLLAATVLYIPVAALFWHAPALVLWHDVPVGKSLFFSAVAVLRNSGAYLLYGVAWMAVSMAAWIALLLLASLLANLSIAVSGMFPVSIWIATMFYASLWFTFRDSFSVEDEAAPAPEQAPQ